MAWREVDETTPNYITRFVNIMRQMDAGYDGLTTKLVAEWLGDGYHYAFYNDAPLEIVLLLRTRDNKHPEIVMLGWLPADPLSVSTADLKAAANSVITKVRDWADHLPNPKSTVRAVCPKRMGNAAIHKLHVALASAIDLDSVGGIAKLARPSLDLGDSFLWYIQKQ